MYRIKIPGQFKQICTKKLKSFHTKIKTQKFTKKENELEWLYILGHGIKYYEPELERLYISDHNIKYCKPDNDQEKELESLDLMSKLHSVGISYYVSDMQLSNNKIESYVTNEPELELLESLNLMSKLHSVGASYYVSDMQLSNNKINKMINYPDVDKSCVTNEQELLPHTVSNTYISQVQLHNTDELNWLNELSINHIYGND